MFGEIQNSYRKMKYRQLKTIFDSPLSKVEFCGLAVSYSLDFDKGRVLVLITESTSVSGENTLSVQAAHGWWFLKYRNLKL